MKWNELNHAYKVTGKKEIEKLKWYFDRWFHSEDTIYTAYENPSQEKIDWYEYFSRLAYDNYSIVTGINVITHNTFVFTMGYEFMDNETGEMCFMYITPTYSRYCPICELQ